MEHGEMEREMRKGRYCLVAGAAAAGGGAGGRLTTAAQPRSGEAKRRDRWRPGHIHLSPLSPAHRRGSGGAAAK